MAVISRPELLNHLLRIDRQACSIAKPGIADLVPCTFGFAHLFLLIFRGLSRKRFRDTQAHDCEVVMTRRKYSPSRGPRSNDRGLLPEAKRAAVARICDATARVHGREVGWCARLNHACYRCQDMAEAEMVVLG